MKRIDAYRRATIALEEAARAYAEPKANIHARKRLFDAALRFAAAYLRMMREL
jgi:hypothetical protein